MPKKEVTKHNKVATLLTIQAVLEPNGKCLEVKEIMEDCMRKVLKDKGVTCYKTIITTTVLSLLIICNAYAVDIPTTPSPQIISTTISDLTPGTHCFTVTSFDAAGNESKPSDEVCVTLQEPTTLIWWNQKFFTNTVVKSQRYKTFTIYNRGNIDLVCNQPIITGRNITDFRTDFIADKRSVPAGNSISFKAYFKPMALGERLASMAIKCNQNDADLVVVLSGLGI
jgi:hypothetical protein